MLVHVRNPLCCEVSCRFCVCADLGWSVLDNWLLVFPVCVFHELGRKPCLVLMDKTLCHAARQVPRKRDDDRAIRMHGKPHVPCASAFAEGIGKRFCFKRHKGNIANPPPPLTAILSAPGFFHRGEVRSSMNLSKGASHRSPAVRPPPLHQCAPSQEPATLPAPKHSQ